MNKALTMHLSPLRAQRGGTILGIIIGVLVGLGAALAVAVYVTKVPVPFVNKAPVRAADQDAAEAKKNKDWDPNTPLYGKNPAKPNAAASAAASVEPPLAVASATPPAKASKPAASASDASGPVAAKIEPQTKTATAANPDIKNSADPLGDLAKAKAKIAAGAVGGGLDPFTYFVQAGAYRTPEDADAQRAKLGMLGMDAKITEREQSGRTVYRVRVGPFDKKDDAEKTKEKLDGSGMDTALVRTQR